MAENRTSEGLNSQTSSTGTTGSTGSPGSTGTSGTGIGGTGTGGTGSGLGSMGSGTGTGSTYGRSTGTGPSTGTGTGAATALSQTGQRISDAATQAKDYVSDKVAVVGDKLKELQNADFGEMAENAKDYARRNPGQAILISAAAGLVLGLILRGRR